MVRRTNASIDQSEALIWNTQDRFADEVHHWNALAIYLKEHPGQLESIEADLIRYVETHTNLAREMAQTHNVDQRRCIVGSICTLEVAFHNYPLKFVGTPSLCGSRAGEPRTWDRLMELSEGASQVDLIAAAEKHREIVTAVVKGPGQALARVVEAHGAEAIHAYRVRHNEPAPKALRPRVNWVSIWRVLKKLIPFV